MAGSKCCFGCSNVRRCSWIIAIFDMVICFILMLGTLSSLNFVPYSYKKNSVTRDSFGGFTYGEEVPTTYYDRRIQQMEIDLNMFCQLFILFLFFYVNLNLKKATLIHNAQSINQWLVTNSIFFLFFILYVGFTTIKSSVPYMIPIGIPVSIVVVYQIYVVKRFYEDELKFLATSDRNVVTQSTLNSPPYVTISSQTVQAPVYPVQSGPYVIHQMRQPITQAPYPQQTFQYQPQQQPSQPQVGLPPSEPHAPQEYCNPPPYSPNYNVQEGGPSIKH